MQLQSEKITREHCAIPNDQNTQLTAEVLMEMPGAVSSSQSPT